MQALFVIDLREELSSSEIDVVCQPDPWEQIVRITRDEDASMEALAAQARVFDSRGQARKNGFSGPIPQGLELWGTNQRTFWCWNPRPPTQPPTISDKRRKTDQWFRFALASGRVHGPGGPWPRLLELPPCLAWLA